MSAETPVPPILKPLTYVVLAVTGLLLGLWLWSRFCLFPSIPWNDIRLAPSIALSQGWPVYPTTTSGTITTWMYGPLPLLYLWPASWAPTASGALMVAAGLTILLTLVPLALVCAAWPVTSAGTDAPAGRLTAFVGCLALWPALHYSVIFSDNLAIACGLLGNLLLVRARQPWQHWLAALAAVAAIGCKQICLGIPLAQVIWMGLVAGRAAGIRHLVRCLVSGAILGGALIVGFGWSGLWFTLAQVPAGLGFVPDLGGRLLAVAPTMSIHLGLPLLVMLIWRRAFTGPLLLPAVSWLCTLPFGVAGMLSLGGWTNSVHSFVLWLPPVLIALLAGKRSGPLRSSVPMLVALGTAALVSGRLLRTPDLPLRPKTDDYQLAAQIAIRHPQGVWFPLHPLVTLYSDRKYYHDEDGLFVRKMAGRPPSSAQLASQLPAAMQLIALNQNWNDWGIARRMLPANSRQTTVGNWVLREGLTAEPAP
jgi:hypothetical protein